ncbi:hypothetical protein GCM10023183_05110 [Nibribacter koreensis]|uniref:Uncharacterized protein n=1 Tax=Nibribacter koreensis TaxID=1084519 RepID=A0ABP8F8L8_9BACT
MELPFFVSDTRAASARVATEGTLLYLEGSLVAGETKDKIDRDASARIILFISKFFPNFDFITN